MKIGEMAGDAARTKMPVLWMFVYQIKTWHA